MQGYTIYKAIEFLMDWNNLSPAQRAVGILTIVEATLRAISDGLVEIYKAIRNLDPDSLGFQLQCVRWSNASAKKVKMQQDAESPEDLQPVLDEESIALIPRINEDGEVNPEIPERSVSQQMGEGGATVAPEAPLEIAKKFSLSSLAVEGVMLALNIASVVMMAQELKNDWGKIDDGIKAMDTINLIVQYAQVVTGGKQAVARSFY